MSPPPKKKTPSPVPVLTEMVDADMSDIPTLTEIHIEQAAPLTDAQCQQLAKLIAPQLENLLQKALLDVQANLPDLIRNAVKREHPL